MAKDKNYSAKPQTQGFGGGRGPMGGGRMTAAGEKPKNMSGTWKKLISYCKPYLPMIIAALVIGVIGSLISVIGPGQLRTITDMITAGISSTIDLAGIGRICAVLAGLYLLGFVSNYFQNAMMASSTQKIVKQLRSDTSQKINRLPLKYFDSTSTGDILSRMTNDIDSIGQTLNQSIGSLVNSTIGFVGSLVMMLLINVVMTLTAIVATLIGFGLMSLIISKSQKYFTRQQKHLGEINGHIEEIYSGHSVVKAYNGEEAASETFDHINENMVESGWKSQFLSGLMQPLMGFIGNLGYVAVCVVGALLAINGYISFGVIVAFMIYIRMFTQPLSQFAQAATTLQSTAAASERVFEFLEEKELADESDKKAVLYDAQGNVEFRDVRFGYTDEKIIIQDFNADVKSGQKIAIVGPTGAGKTTIVNLLMRFYDVNSGEIRVDGVPISELTRENVHELFCMVLQDTWLFDGTIKENIIYNKKGVSDDQVIAACKAVGIDHFIRTLPKGYDTILNDHANLSAGQKQLITIARAMVENAPMLILDEATSSVDTRIELQIQAAMDKLMAGRTSFVIAHRLSTIKNADLILVMRDGSIVESGTHEELLKKNGFYAELYNSQFVEEEDIAV